MVNDVSGPETIFYPAEPFFIAFVSWFMFIWPLVHHSSPSIMANAMLPVRRSGLLDAHHHRLRKLKHAARFAPDESLTFLVMNVIIARQAVDGNDTVGTRLVQTREEAEPGDAADARRKNLTHPVGHEQGDVAVNRITLGGGGAAFGGGDILGDFF